MPKEQRTEKKTREAVPIHVYKDRCLRKEREEGREAKEMLFRKPTDP